MSVPCGGNKKGISKRPYINDALAPGNDGGQVSPIECGAAYLEESGGERLEPALDVGSGEHGLQATLENQGQNQMQHLISLAYVATQQRKRKSKGQRTG